MSEIFVELKIEPASSSINEKNHIFDATILRKKRYHRIYSLLISIVFILSTMSIGVVVVYFTSPEKQSLLLRTILSTMNNMALADFNHDSYTDMIIAYSNNDRIGLFFGSINGTYVGPLLYPSGNSSQPSSIAVGDLNHDQYLDFVVSNYHSHTIKIFYGDSKNDFNRTIENSAMMDRPFKELLNDMNYDHYQDIVTLYKESRLLIIWFGDANGTFHDELAYSVENVLLSFSIKIHDFNKDSRLDILIINTNQISVFLGRENGTFASEMIFTIGVSFGAFLIADLDGDERMDLAISSDQMAIIHIFLGYDAGTIGHQCTFTTGSASHPTSIFTNDFNHDNHSDLLAANTSANSTSIRYGLGHGTFSDETTFFTGEEFAPEWIVIGNLNRGNQSDVVLASPHSDNLQVWMGVSNGLLIYEELNSLPTGSFPSSLVLSYLDDDDWLDLAAVTPAMKSVTLLNRLKDGYYGQGLIVLEGFNHDQKVDVIAIAQTSQMIELLANVSQGSFISVQNYSPLYKA